MLATRSCTFGSGYGLISTMQTSYFKPQLQIESEEILCATLYGSNPRVMNERALQMVDKIMLDINSIVISRPSLFICVFLAGL